MKKQKFLIRMITLTIAVMFIGAGNLYAVDREWNGGSTAWLTATNWTPNGVPAADDNLTIIGGVTQPTISVAGALCNNLTFNRI